MAEQPPFKPGSLFGRPQPQGILDGDAIVRLLMGDTFASRFDALPQQNIPLPRPDPRPRQSLSDMNTLGAVPPGALYRLLGISAPPNYGDAMIYQPDDVIQALLDTRWEDI